MSDPPPSPITHFLRMESPNWGVGILVLEQDRDEGFFLQMEKIVDGVQQMMTSMDIGQSIVNCMTQFKL